MTQVSPSVPNSPQELLDRNTSSWEDSVCSQVSDHTPLEVLSLVVRLTTMVENYCNNTLNETNLRYNLVTLGELSVVRRVVKNLVSELEELTEDQE